MKILKFDDFLSYILNVTFTDQIIEGNNDILYTESLIKMMYEIHNNYVNVKNELIYLKGEADSKEIFNAKLDSLMYKLNTLEIYKNFNIVKIKNWLNEFEITEFNFFKWHDQIQERNDLYIILDTHISWLDPNMEPDVKSYPFLKKYNPDDVQAIHNSFTEFIKDHYIRKLLNFLEDQKFLLNNKEITRSYKDHIWFKVGLLFATGEIEGLKNTFNSNSTQIAKNKFGDKWKSFRPYISESISNTNTSDKNIFSNHDKMLKIIQHCEEKNKTVTKGFKSKLPPE